MLLFNHDRLRCSGIQFFDRFTNSAFWRRQIMLSSGFDGLSPQHLILPSHTAHRSIPSRSPRDYHTIRRLNAYQTSPDPKPLISVLQESCPHTKAIDKLPWMGFRKINLSIDSRFYCNLDELDWCSLRLWWQIDDKCNIKSSHASNLHWVLSIIFIYTQSTGKNLKESSNITVIKQRIGLGLVNHFQFTQ